MTEWVVSDEDLGCDGAYFSYKEIVRCKDCKYYNRQHHYCEGIGNWFGYEGEWSDNGFCYKGERREDDEISIMDYSDMPGDTISTEYGTAHDDENSDEG